MNNGTRSNVQTYLSRLSHVISRLDVCQIDNAIGLIEEAWKAGRQIICLGNGGSALTALHYITDWNKSLFLSIGVPFRGRTLCDNIGLMMAYSNDISYEDVFVEQLKDVMMKEDLVIGISGSGNSENVIRAIKYANDNDAVTLGICGYDGGRLKAMAQHHVWANVSDMQLSEDVHGIFGHIVMQTLCGYLDHVKVKQLKESAYAANDAH
jgi:D-sedoheptulose 7-phosphate isomerase